jgi:hypothetical protein
LKVIRLDSSGRPLNDRSVLELLAAEHTPQHLYRGQTDRHLRPWPAESRPSIKVDEYMLDSLIPSDYRGVEDQIRHGNKSNPDVALAYGDEAAHARFALILSGITILQRESDGPAISAWYDGLPENSVKNFVLSIAQHVGIPTENIDLSHSPEVAWWFATHSWEGLYQTGEGIIYRLDQDPLETAIGKLNRQEKRKRAELIEIGDGPHRVPNSLTPRPAAQAGLTLAGGEVGEVLLELIAVDGITAFVFQRDHAAHPLSIAAIKPVEDPLVTFIGQAKVGVWDDEWQRALREFLHGANIVNIPNIRDHHLRAAVFEGYAGIQKIRSKPTFSGNG